MKQIFISIIAAGLVAILSGCVDRANAPLLLPVGSPAQPAEIVQRLCVGDANAAYNRAREEFTKRARMSGVYSPSARDEFADEAQAKAAARMKYISCTSSQGYKAVY